MRTILPLSLLLTACASAPPAAHVATPDGVLIAKLEGNVYDAAAHADTCKPYHAVFTADGRLLSKGLGGTYPHHRGLFVGWNQVQQGAERFDFWHCNRGESQRLRALLTPAEHGRGSDWQVAAIDWTSAAGKVVLQEQRALRARELETGVTAIEVELTLSAVDGEVRLDGDPQHAGCQFRALQQFADRPEPAIRYLRPSTATGGKDDIWTGCGWIAAVLPLSPTPVTVLRCEGTGNPEAIWSTRPYGRFGAMCRATLAPGNPLQLRYVYVVADGERDAAWCAGTWHRVTVR